MILVVADDLSFRPEGPSDFKRFYIECHAARDALDTGSTVLANTAAVDGEDHARIRDAALIELSGPAEEAAFPSGSGAA